LAKNFEGEHRWITDPKHNPGAKIDSMFFPYTGEQAIDEDYSLEYKDKTTFILCNPNAMFYQHMINYPHAYYLRFFQQRGFNIIVWNYRGYGRSHPVGCCSPCRNQPRADNIQKDAESVLRYAR
jgi:pimeloyl-ACP methyl ester carboxylesterase